MINVNNILAKSILLVCRNVIISFNNLNTSNVYIHKNMNEMKSMIQLYDYMNKFLKRFVVFSITY